MSGEGKGTDAMFKNKLICGDNLEELAEMDKESVDLIYIDPPFFSNRNYEIIWGDEAEVRSFDDRWEGGINVYVDWMKQRVMELHRVLKPSGSFYLHCDWHAGHYLKVMCDEVFGYNNFQNEIVWEYQTGGATSIRFSRKHDNIFFFTKSDKWHFYPDEIQERRTEKSLARAQNPKGARISATDEFKNPTDVFHIQALNPMAKERLNYPTQKPEALLERVIKASSNKGDIVLDAFCGSGTALAVAEKLGRHWIGIDISPSAIALIKNRFKTFPNVFCREEKCN
jgi:DNA modification methylase